MPASRNARGIDIITYDSSGANFIGVQVKTLTKRNSVPLGGSLDKVMGDYWVIINEEANAFILLPQEVRDSAHRGEKNGKVSFWLQPKSYDTEVFKEA